MAFLLAFAAFSFLATPAFCGFPPPPEGITTIQIPDKPGVSISYKETTICETRAKSYAGYVHIPSSYLDDTDESEPYNISTFFWYFEARQNPRNAQTAIYLAGGPGQSSMFGAAQSGGPCSVLADSNTTEDNPWSWNKFVNLLYVDQPVGTGFSYTSLVNSTKDLMYLVNLDNLNIVPFESYNGSVPAENTTFLYGTFPSQDPANTPGTSQTAANTLWHFAQFWFTSFPEYKTVDKRVSFWGHSYGGYWVPFSAARFVEQNEAIEAGKLNGTILPVDTAGWTNGCTDLLYQGEWTPDMAYNNTYGLQVLPDDVYAAAKEAWGAEGGARDQLLACRKLGDQYDPDFLGLNDTVNAVCANATLTYGLYVQAPYNAVSNLSVFDIAQLEPSSQPPSYLDGFFNRESVQRALGVPLNFTANSYATQLSFGYTTGDPVRAAGLKQMEYLLTSGVKLSMIYGDRDYRCPWLGAEKLSLAANWTGSEAFRNAGYEYIHTDDCYPGGVVRQHGNLSFSRVFQAGHDAAFWQPKTVFEIFTRSMLGFDVATGKMSTLGEKNYSSSGPESSFGIKNPLPVSAKIGDCNLYNVEGTCTIEQFLALRDGTAEVEEGGFRVVKPVGDEGTTGALRSHL
ncbi:uncharacterized protein MYCFIDRAFT_78999 [Pseudocercospora fijiensis CIRAD86]|uniref:Uncharacterized protein n=1 Tax=Pseudocercospora fijiensis (strain CIRAD86) TaxID=383855 RepID=M2ZU77_PSEFD|nr:uncharacterized protein MYCFIDRAFT_78999 [Pseudocercospora fijiensis CIRAD86]EME82559.1 hypothetical protein MYCFIDRAFT_78999 [Pseudocercospora fijiensis CIRAD86]